MKLNYICEKQNVSLKDLANKSGVSLSYIYNLSNGYRCNPSLETLNSIAKALNVTIDDLLKL